MDASVDQSLFSHFAVLPDPRKSCLHPLSEILVIAICAVLCGAESWMAIEAFGKAQRKWFRSFLTLQHGIPSHDTFGRVFALLDTEAFAQCFLAWTQALEGSLEGKHVALDGKTLRRSFDRAAEKAAIHMVSAWAVGNAVVLGQRKTEEKSNEITAIPQLLRKLHLKGCLVTIDAMGCQKAIATQIIDQGGEYVLSLKDNHPTLHADVIELFDYALAAPQVSSEVEAVEIERPPPAVTTYITCEKAHGRVEERAIYCIQDVSLLPNREEWKGLSSVVMVVSKRTLGDKTSQEWRYYLSSCKDPKAEKIADVIRRHWSIENELHWVLDVVYREDDCRVRQKQAAANLSILRHLTLNLLQRDKNRKTGVQIKRQQAGWDVAYRQRLLGLSSLR